MLLGVAFFLIIGFSIFKMFLTTMIFAIIVLYLILRPHQGDSVDEEPGIVCCMDQSPRCIACRQGMSLEQYCQENPGTIGCT